MALVCAVLAFTAVPARAEPPSYRSQPHPS